ncbi:hypothetical protein TWF730_008190 [Orbilia blumenaviensis]|uniref:Uncharacterized protein n=1 Tax=Orbilia blumenaviensis TaxID=1796055 RepID=A0AAV9V1Y5_9PEZI
MPGAVVIPFASPAIYGRIISSPQARLLQIGWDNFFLLPLSLLPINILFYHLKNAC